MKRAQKRSNGRRPSGLKNRKKSLGRARSTILIVTEGRVSEPQYFKCLSRECGLGHEVEVRDLGDDSAPSKLVKHVKGLLSRKKFDYIYLVFDRDRHSS